VSVLKVRKRERHRLKKTLSETEYKEIVKGMMWIIRKNNRDLPHPKWDLPHPKWDLPHPKWDLTHPKWDLTADERKKLRRLFEYSPKLKLAYTFREELTAIFEMRLTKEEAKKRLLKWAGKVSRSALTYFDKFLTTLNNWLNEIVNYFVRRLSSGFVEGTVLYGQYRV